METGRVKACKKAPGAAFKVTSLHGTRFLPLSVRIGPAEGSASPAARQPGALLRRNAARRRGVHQQFLGGHSAWPRSIAVQMRACAYSSPRIEVRRYRIL